jgi:hypothetical protein
MKAYKLVRQLKSGEITSLFINKKQRLPIGKWLEAECHKTNGFALRPGWHCVATPKAPHLSTRGRIWAEVEIEEFESLDRPEHQGAVWYLAKRMKIVRALNEQ